VGKRLQLRVRRTLYMVGMLAFVARESVQSGKLDYETYDDHFDSGLAFLCTV